MNCERNHECFCGYKAESKYALKRHKQYAHPLAGTSEPVPTRSAHSERSYLGMRQTKYQRFTEPRDGGPSSYPIKERY